MGTIWDFYTARRLRPECSELHEMLVRELQVSYVTGEGGLAALERSNGEVAITQESCVVSLSKHLMGEKLVIA